MSGTGNALRWIVMAAAGAAYLALSYVTAASDHPPWAGVLLALLPLTGAALVAAWHAPARRLALLAWAAAVAVVGSRMEVLRSHAAWLFFIQHAGSMVLLGLSFGSTLRGGPAQALCSRIAAMISPEPLDSTYLRYTWNVTLAWTAYFVLVAAGSALLFFLSPIEAWSFFANVLTPATLGLMFAGEYLVRQRALPGRPQISIAATVRAYRQFNRQARPGPEPN